MQARYYDPVIGRFYSNDPVDALGHMSRGNSIAHGFNRYAYANNNPYKYTDPDGEFVNFAVKFVADVALGAALNYAETGSLNLGGAVTDAAVGVLNPAKTVQKAQRLAKALKRSCCFVAGTQVLTEDGYKNIEDVKLGEKLWAKNTETGEQDWKPVTKIFVEPDRGIYEVLLRGDDGFEQKIQATDDHPFFVVGKGWKDTIELEVGDLIETDGHGSMEVISVIDEQRVDLTYNFTVADFHTYYVTERNVLVHNCGFGNKRVLENTKIRHKEISMDVERGGSGKINVHAKVDGVKFFKNEDGQFVSKDDSVLNKKIVNDPKFQKALDKAAEVIEKDAL
jgi:RHS repeat-associated protein